MAVKTEKLHIRGPAGALEALLEQSDPIRAGWFAVVCHPHPQHQGTMLNKVVHTLSRSLTDLGVTTLRFNYRGVGTSEGEYDGGAGETEDAASVIEFMQQRQPGAASILAGFSFGAGVAIRQAMQRPPAALITVAPPVGRIALPTMTGITCPWLVVQGSDDELVDGVDVQRWASQQLPAPQLEMMPGVSHFFHGHLTRLRHHVSEFVRPRLSE